MPAMDILGKISFGKYPYLAARMRAMKSKLMTRMDYEKMLKMDIYTMTKYLYEHSFPIQEELMKEGIKPEDVIEMAVNKSLEECFRKLLFITAGNTRKIIVAYAYRYDIENLKVLVRARISNEPLDLVEKLWVCAGTLTKEKLRELYQLESLEDVMKKARIFKVDKKMKQATEVAEKEGNPAVIENLFDKRYYTFLVKYTKRFGREAEPISKLIKLRFDIMNLRTLYRLKREGVSKEEILKWIHLTGGYRLKKKELEQLASASNLRELHEKVKNTYYGSIIGSVDISTTLIDLELKLSQYFLGFASTLMHAHPLSIVPVIAFMMMKEVEANNIKLIARGKAKGVDENFIRNNLVVYA